MPEDAAVMMPTEKLDMTAAAVYKGSLPAAIIAAGTMEMTLYSTNLLMVSSTALFFYFNPLHPALSMMKNLYSVLLLIILDDS
ncbi:hypothetical protein V8C44DRAFT_41503 [Trichoderma aethiopicum]